MIPSAYLFKNTTLKIAPRIITHLPLPDPPTPPTLLTHTQTLKKFESCFSRILFLLKLLTEN